MKTLLICTALVTASVSAHAQNSFSFDINGKKVHVAVPKHCDDEFCFSVSTEKGEPGVAINGRGGLRDALSKFMKSRNHQDDDDDADASDPKPPIPPKKAVVAEPKAVVAEPRAVVAEPKAFVAEPKAFVAEPKAFVAEPKAFVAEPAPVASVQEHMAAGMSADPKAADPKAADPKAADPTVAAEDKPVSPPAPVTNRSIAAVEPHPAITAPSAPPLAAPEPARKADLSPVGTWMTEKKEGKIHIVPCGENLCGYVVDAKSNTDGEQVLIDMRPVTATKWSGQIHKPKGGGTYDATIALKGPDALRVQGCAFGGMVCGGQTWSRV